MNNANGRTEAVKYLRLEIEKLLHDSNVRNCLKLSRVTTFAMIRSCFRAIFFRPQEMGPERLVSYLRGARVLSQLRSLSILLLSIASVCTLLYLDPSSLIHVVSGKSETKSIVIPEIPGPAGRDIRFKCHKPGENCADEVCYRDTCLPISSQFQSSEGRPTGQGSQISEDVSDIRDIASRYIETELYQAELKRFQAEEALEKEIARKKREASEPADSRLGTVIGDAVSSVSEAIWLFFGIVGALVFFSAIAAAALERNCLLILSEPIDSYRRKTPLRAKLLDFIALRGLIGDGWLLQLIVNEDVANYSSFGSSRNFIHALAEELYESSDGKVGSILASEQFGNVILFPPEISPEKLRWVHECASRASLNLLVKSTAFKQLLEDRATLRRWWSRTRRSCLYLVFRLTRARRDATKESKPSGGISLIPAVLVAAFLVAGFGFLGLAYSYVRSPPSVVAVRDGRDGRDGKDGKDGRDGTDGAAGLSGNNGENGKNGNNGENGKNGENGRNDEKGKTESVTGGGISRGDLGAESKAGTNAIATVILSGSGTNSDSTLGKRLQSPPDQLVSFTPANLCTPKIRNCQGKADPRQFEPKDAGKDYYAFLEADSAASGKWPPDPVIMAVSDFPADDNHNLSNVHQVPVTRKKTYSDFFDADIWAEEVHTKRFRLGKDLIVVHIASRIAQ